MAGSEIIINSEYVVGEVVKNEKGKFVVSKIDSNIGEYVAIQNVFIKKDGSTGIGKSTWLPAKLADQIAELIKEAADDGR